MAIQGKYNFKGIDLADSYIKIYRVDYNTVSNKNTVLKTAAVYNSDGSLKTAEVYEDKWDDTQSASYSARVYKDKDTRDNSPNNVVEDIHASFVMAVTSSAKNPLKQAYDAMRATDAYKDYTDV